MAGGSGSGKTTLALRLKERFGEDEVRLISHDSYYKRHDELPYEERCKLNYDHPDSFDTPLLYGMTEYVGRSYSERSTNYGYGGRTSTNVVIRPKKSKDSMIVPASGHVLLAEDLGGSYGCTVVIDHGAGLRSIFYGLTALDVEAGDDVKQGQLLGTSGRTVVAELRIGTVPINPLLVWRGQCDGLKYY